MFNFQPLFYPSCVNSVKDAAAKEPECFSYIVLLVWTTTSSGAPYSAACKGSLLALHQNIKLSSNQFESTSILTYIVEELNRKEKIILTNFFFSHLKSLADIFGFFTN
jgi:hypothetical protein